ncbi:hypothetical protein VTJ04DRAFT_8966 [Mycothermus thermophilus]|uniref:uncharacterized protein n=1 Tax=Humicola insolens TaxID=85995 RepID=UPI003744250B
MSFRPVPLSVYFPPSPEHIEKHATQTTSPQGSVGDREDQIPEDVTETISTADNPQHPLAEEQHPTDIDKACDVHTPSTTTTTTSPVNISFYEADSSDSSFTPSPHRTRNRGSGPPLPPFFSPRGSLVTSPTAHLNPLAEEFTPTADISMRFPEKTEFPLPSPETVIADANQHHHHRHLHHLPITSPPTAPPHLIPMTMPISPPSGPWGQQQQQPLETFPSSSPSVLHSPFSGTTTTTPSSHPLYSPPPLNAAFSDEPDRSQPSAVAANPPSTSDPSLLTAQWERRHQREISRALRRHLDNYNYNNYNYNYNRTAATNAVFRPYSAVHQQHQHRTGPYGAQPDRSLMIPIPLDPPPPPPGPGLGRSSPSTTATATTAAAAQQQLFPSHHPTNHTIYSGQRSVTTFVSSSQSSGVTPTNYGSGISGRWDPVHILLHHHQQQQEQQPQQQLFPPPLHHHHPPSPPHPSTLHSPLWNPNHPTTSTDAERWVWNEEGLAGVRLARELLEEEEEEEENEK